MQEPIKKDDRYLWVYLSDGENPIHGELIARGEQFGKFHPQALRLPDKFQVKKECDCNCCNNHPHLEKECHQAIHSKVDPVENWNCRHEGGREMTNNFVHIKRLTLGFIVLFLLCVITSILDHIFLRIPSLIIVPIMLITTYIIGVFLEGFK